MFSVFEIFTNLYTNTHKIKIDKEIQIIKHRAINTKYTN